MAPKICLLIAFVLAAPLGTHTAPSRPLPDPGAQAHEQTRHLLAEWRKAIRQAETPGDWAAVDAMAREVSRLAALARYHSAHGASNNSTE